MANHRNDPSDRGSTAYVYALASVAALGGLLFGYDTAVVSGAIGFMTERFGMDEVTKGWAASCALVGCIAGAALAGTLSDWLGRRRVLLISAVLFIVSAVWSGAAWGLSDFVVARILGGFGVGAASMLSPLYIAEVAPARIRGRLVSLNQLAIVSGMLLVYYVNAWIAEVNAEDAAWNVLYGWRWMFASETLPAVLFFALLFGVPESPRWLTQQGQADEAMAVLTRASDAAAAEAQMAEIRDALAQQSSSLAQLLEPGVRVALLVAVVLAVLQQITGINVVLYYAPEIFKSAGLAAGKAINDTVLVGVVNVAFTLAAIAVVDRLGRKALLLVASAGMGVSLFLLGGAFYLQQFKGRWILLFTLAYVASFAVAMGPVVWVVMSEIFPTRIRGRAMSIATVCLWTACYAVSQSFPWMLEELGGAATFWFYAATCGAAFLFVALCVPETKGRTLEEIERSWSRP